MPRNPCLARPRAGLQKEDGLSAKSVNHLRGYLSRAFTMARRMEKFPRPNPVADVPTRKVVKRLPDYLRLQERLRFGPEAADRSGRTSIPASAEEKLGRLAAGGASELPSPARRCASRVHLLPDPEKGHAPASRRGTAGKRSRGLRVVGARGFEPPTFRSRNGMGTLAPGTEPSQVGKTITGGEGVGVQPSQGFAANERNFTTHLLPESGSAPGAAIERCPSFSKW